MTIGLYEYSPSFLQALVAAFPIVGEGDEEPTPPKPDKPWTSVGTLVGGPRHIARMRASP